MKIRMNEAGYTLFPIPVYVLLVLSALLILATRAEAQIETVDWVHLSSSDGDLPVPPDNLAQVSIRVLDLDKNGQQDYVLTLWGTEEPVVWYRRIGDTYEKYVIDTETDYLSHGEGFKDIDGDGDIDLLFGDAARDHSIYWWENPYPVYDPNTPWVRRTLYTTNNAFFHDNIWGDFDDDGFDELIVWNQYKKHLLLFEIPADPKNQTLWTSSEIFQWSGIEKSYKGTDAIDINLDGKLDFVGGCGWFEHVGGTNFVRHPVDDTKGYSIVKAGQLVTGGRPEIVCLVELDSADLNMYEWSGTQWVEKTLLSNVPSSHSMQLGDINGDGYLDVMVGELRGDNGRKLYALYGDGAGNFTQQVISEGYEHIEGQLEDLDGDGDLDIIAQPTKYMIPRVDMWINQGPQIAISVPVVVGLDQAQAESAIVAAGLTVGTVTTSSSYDVPTGYVISQSPLSGTSVPSGSAVYLVVSSGVGPAVTELIADWPMNEGSGTTTADTTGNGHNGTLVNGPLWALDRGLEFDGVNDYIDVGALDIAGSAMTLSAWFRADNLSNCSARDCRIISKASGLSGADHYFMVSTVKVGTTTRLRFRLKTNGTTATLVATSGDLLDNQWVHVAAVYDGATMKLYKDGVEVGSAAKTGSITTNSGVSAWIGGNPPGATARAWDGQIDDVRVYSRALTASEIANLIGGDSTPPLISNIQVSVTDTTATVTWDTDEPADSQVDYGPDSTYGSTASDTGLVLSHSVTLTGISAETQYHYRVSSADGNTNSASSVDLIFTTAAVDTTPPLISNIQVSVTAATATVSWDTDEPADSQVDYGLDSAYGSTASDAGLVISHSVPLTGLSAETQYHYRVSSADGSTNSASSADLIFTTGAAATGLIADWPMNEGSGTTTADTTGNGHDGTLVNDPLWALDRGLNFDGVNDYIDVGALDIAGSAMTLSAWFRADNLSNCSARDCRIISKASGLSGADHYFMVSTIKVGTTTRLRFRLKTNGTTATLVATSGDLLDNQWVHVAAVYDGATMKLYKDGVEVGSAAKTGSITTNSGVSAWIGGNPPGATARAWDGQIDDVRVYSRALTASEIANLIGGDSTPPLISNIQVSVTDTTATVSWDTDEPADSQVDYGPDSTYGSTASDAGLVLSHSVTLTGISAETQYHYRVSSADGSTNSASSVDLIFTTAAADATPPVISNIQVSVTAATATVSWDTDEPADSQVDYGPDSTYGSTASDAGGLVISHSVTLTGLSAETQYHYRVSSADGSTNSASSADLIFTTATADTTPPLISNIQVSVTDTTATVTWDTDEPAGSQVDYGPDSDYGMTASDAGLVISHSVTLTGISAEMLYHYQVSSADGSTNSASSGDLTFNTPAFVQLDGISSDFQNPTLVSGDAFSFNLVGTGFTATTSGDFTLDFGTDGVLAFSNFTKDSIWDTGSAISPFGINDALIGVANSSEVNPAGDFPIGTINFVLNGPLDEITSIMFADFTGFSAPDLSIIDVTYTTAYLQVVPSVPALAGLSMSAAESEIVAAGLSVGTVTTSYSDTVPDGDVISQNPLGGTSVPSGSEVDLVVSSGEEPAATGLIADWPMNEGSGTTTADTTGNGHDGTLVNDPLWALDRGLNFDGVNDYIDVGALDIAGSAMTLSAWFRADNLSNCSARDCRIISKASGLSGADHYFMVSTIKVGTTTRLRFRLKTNGTTATLVATSGDLLDNQWVHVAAVYDGATMKLYKDGVEVGSAAKTGSITTNSGVSAWIGGNPPGATARAWDGQIDDVRVYSRALTASEIANLIGGDSTPPLISNIQVSVTDTTATVSWDTDEPADSQVDYGPDSTYGSTASDAGLVLSHSVTLTGISAETQYHYRVSSADGSTNSASSVDLIFTTAAADATPPVISNIQVSVTDTTATVTWDTDEPADSQVDYGPDSTYGSTASDTGLVLSHSVTLTGISAETQYHYRVSSADGNTNSASSADLIFTTATADTTPPLISNIQVSVTDTTATVSWDTDEPAGSQVDYGPDSTYGSTASDAGLVISHSVTLTGLSAETQYHYRVSSADGSTNSASSVDLTFTTSSGGSSPSGLVTDHFNAGSLNTGLWAFVDPVGNSSVSMTDTHAAILVPAGTNHDVWRNNNAAARLRQASNNTDFEVEVKFDSVLSEQFQIQGIVAEQDGVNLVRFDFYNDGSVTRIYSASFVNGIPSKRVQTVITNSVPLYLRVKRQGNQWTEEYSYDGANWTVAGTFSHNMTVTSVSVFGGNAGASPPALTSLIDYFVVDGLF